MWDFPTIVDGREMVCRGIYQVHLGYSKQNIHTKLSDYLALKGLDINNYKIKYFAGRAYNSNDIMSNERMILVGEAAGIDPVSGEGISQAINYGLLAGYYSADVLAKRASFRDWGKVIRKSSLGRNLSFRNRTVNVFYGPARPVMEHYLIN
jgi:flavin-dependent dehydrogenase